MVKFRRQTSKPAASSAPPRRATAPRKKNPIWAFLHTRVKDAGLSLSDSMYGPDVFVCVRACDVSKKNKKAEICSKRQLRTFAFKSDEYVCM